MKVRAVIRDRRGDIVSDVRYFQDDDDLERYVRANAATFSHYGQRVEKLPPTTLSEWEVATLANLLHLVNQANGVVQYFQTNADLKRRWANRKPTKADLKLAADTLRFAANQFESLAAADYGVKE